MKRTTSTALIPCADAFYTLEIMEKFIPPALASDVPGTMQNVNRFKLADWTGVRIVPSHDPAYWAKHPWAPKEFVP